MTNDRYNRQELIKGWDQKRLQKARVEIVGSGPLAQYAAASLTALGVGYVGINDDSIVGDNEGFLTRNAEKGRKRTQVLEEKLAMLNPETSVIGCDVSSRDGMFSTGVNTPDVLIDLTNSSESKSRVLFHGAAYKVPVISASSDRTMAEMYVINPGEREDKAKLQGFDGKPHGNFPSEILGGMIAEEVRKTLMPIYEGEKTVKHLSYNSNSQKRINGDTEFEVNPREDLNKKRALVVGAGALGNFVALGAALEGIGHIDILDFDEVEAHNLNRQILFYDSVGKKKSLALAEKLREINPDIEIRGLDGKLDENTTYFDQNKPDVIFDCVDSFATRAMINHYAIERQIPLVSGGTNPQSGQVVVYSPGESACLDCKLGVEQALGMKLAGASCKETPDPSVIMANQVIGGMMVGEALKVLDRGYGDPISRILKYDSTVPVRGGLIGPSETCDCEHPETSEWLKDLKERFSFGGKYER